MSTHNQPPESAPATPGDVGPLSIMKSVLSAAFGVQSNANRKRDFESGKFWHFVLGGLVFVVVFVLVVYLAVKGIIAGAV